MRQQDDELNFYSVEQPETSGDFIPVRPPRQPQTVSLERSPDPQYSQPSTSQHFDQYSSQPQSTSQGQLHHRTSQPFQPTPVQQPDQGQNQGFLRVAPPNQSQKQQIYNPYKTVSDALTGAGVNSTVADIGGKLVEEKFGVFGDELRKRMKPGLFKSYFLVDNYYVLRKIKLLLFPVRVQTWERKASTETTVDNQGNSTSTRVYETPKNDINAPDLYIPLMSFITYVLLMGYIVGTDMDGVESSKFTPEVLVVTASFSLFALIFEVFAVKFSLYLIGIVSGSVPGLLDLVAYSSYKYVNVVVNMMAYVMFGTVAYYISTVVTGAAMLYFIVQTLKKRLEEGVRPLNANAKYFLYIFGIFQPFICFFLERQTTAH